MSEPTALPPDPLSGSTLVAYWSYGYDMPDDLGGGFVTGELLLRADGVLLRRQTLYFPTGGGMLSPGFGPWEQVTWWEGEADSERAARVRPGERRRGMTERSGLRQESAPRAWVARAWFAAAGVAHEGEAKSDDTRA